MNQVRNHIEKVVETLVGENIDESSVLKLASDNSSCELTFYYLGIFNQPCLSTLDFWLKHHLY